MWRCFILAFAITAGAGSHGAALLLILVADPLGVSPIGLSPNHGYAVSDRRFVAPQIIAGGKFDSVPVGTSTSPSFRPGMGGRGLRRTLRHGRHSWRHAL